MRKTFLIIFILFCTSYLFAFSDIILNVENEPFLEIKNNQVFEDDELIGNITNGKIIPLEDGGSTTATIEEDDSYIIISLVYKSNDETEYKEIYKFAKRNGNAIYKQEDDDIITYYEDNGLIKKETCYNSDGSFMFSSEYYYDNKNNLIKKIYYDEFGNQDHAYEYVLDNKTSQTRKYIFYIKDKIHSITEYDLETDKVSLITGYDEEDNIKYKRIYDSKTGKPIETQQYSNKSKNPEIWKFLEFDEDGRYYFDEDNYLSTNVCDYFMLSLKQDDIIDWNDFYSARIHQITYDQTYPAYKFLEKILKEKKAIFDDITLCKRNSDTFYCFACTDNDMIDFSKCFEIKLEKKEFDYKSLNKTGKGTGPFGFDIGMTYEEIVDACDGSEPEHIADDRYYVYPKNSHPLFEKYIVWINKKYGLYYIKALGKDISTSDYGTEAKNQFKKLLNILERKYGTFTKVDSIKPDYTLKDEKYWMRALKDGARTYQAYWYASRENINDFDGLYGIILGLENSNKYSTDEAYIWIEYEFRNYDDAVDELNNVL